MRANVNSIVGGCVNDLDGEILDGANDWVNLGLPASGPGAPLAMEFEEPPLTILTVDQAKEALTRADMDLRFLQKVVLANLGDVAFATAQVRNLGPAAALGAEVVFTTTSGIELLGVPSFCSLDGNVGTCPLGTVGTGALRFLDLTFRADALPAGEPTAPRQIIGTVSAPGDFDVDLENNVDSVTLASCELSTYEAESMQHDGGSAFPGGWKFSSGGSVAVSHGFTGQPTLITVRAKGQKAGFQWPEMTLSIDGIAIESRVVSSSFHYQDYVFEVSVPAALREISIHFDNPSTAHDRILFLDRVEVECTPSCEDGLLNQDESDLDCGGSCGPTCEDGSACMDDNDCTGGFCDGAVCTTVSCWDGIENGHEEGVDCGGFCPEECVSCDPATTREAETMFHSTGASTPGGWTLWSNGYASTTHAFAAEPIELTVTAKGDPALGIWPHMVVSIGGVTIGSTFVTSSTWIDYRFEHTPAADTHEVRVAFENDYYTRRTTETCTWTKSWSLARPRAMTESRTGPKPTPTAAARSARGVPRGRPAS